MKRKICMSFKERRPELLPGKYGNQMPSCNSTWSTSHLLSYFNQTAVPQQAVYFFNNRNKKKEDKKMLRNWILNLPTLHVILCTGMGFLSICLATLYITTRQNRRKPVSICPYLWLILSSILEFTCLLIIGLALIYMI